MSQTVAVNEAKKDLSHFIRQAEHGETVIISRRGKAVAALVSTELLEQLKRLQAAGPEAGLAGLRDVWDDDGEFAEILDSQSRQPSSNRESSVFE